MPVLDSASAVKSAAKSTKDVAIAGVSLASRTWFLMVAWITALALFPAMNWTVVVAAVLTLYLYG